MSGFDNEVVVSLGERLQPSTAQAIALMQASATDVSRINHTGNPEGAVSANPGSLCHDPVSGNVYYKQTGTGNTGWKSLGPSSVTLTADDTNTLVGSSFPLLGEQYVNVPVMRTLVDSGNFKFENCTWSTPYVVDSTTTAGKRGTFSTIQSAINACVANGDASTSKIGYIRIRSPGIGSAYNENLSIPNNALICLEGVTYQSQTLSTLGVLVNGSGTIGSVGGLICRNIAFSNGASAYWTIPSGIIFAYFIGCTTNVNVTGTGVIMENCSMISGASCSLSGGTNKFYGSLITTLTMSGGTNTFYNCEMAGITLSNSVAPVFYNCLWPTSATPISGTTSGTPSFYNCEMSSTFNWTGAIRFGNLSQGGTTSGDFLGSSITNQQLARTIQGNVIAFKKTNTDATILNSDYYVGVTDTSAPRTLTLPSTASTTLRPYKGQSFIFKDESLAAGTNNITITPNGGNIDGSGSAVINTNGGFIKLFFDGSNYFKI